MSENENNINTAPVFEEPKKEKKKKKHIGWKIFLILLLCCLIGFPAYYGGRALYNEYSPAYQADGVKGLFNAIVNGKEAEAPALEVPEVVPEPVEIPEPTVKVTVPEEVPQPVSDEMNEAEIFQSTVDSMVSITTTVEGYNFFGQKVQGEASGSGFVVTDDGYILTNFHVIDEATSISVNFYNGDTYTAKLIGYDENNDVAVLKIEADKKLQPVVLGDSDSLKEGQHVVAIGNALGQFSFSITNGIVSGLARNMQVTQNHSMSLVQISCAINSGNSGGALLNMKGEVVGITNAKYSSSGYSSEASVDNVGFAIPINSVEKIVEDIIEKGYIEKTYIGISVGDIQAETAHQLDIEGGAYVYSVTEGGPADKAGLQEGDIITAVNGKPVLNSDALVEIIGSLKAGEKADLSVMRKAKSIELTVVTESQQQSATPQEDAAAQAAEAMPTPDANKGSDPYSDYGSNSWMQQFFNYYYNH